jgi:anti-sigma B factor antagonist
MAKEKDGCFKIANVNEHVYEIIEIIGATTLLEIYDNTEEAIKSL